MKAAAWTCQLVLLGTLLLTGCGGSADRPPPRPHVAPVVLTRVELSVVPSEDLLDWAEWAYPGLFAFGGLTQSATLNGMSAQTRSYPGPGLPRVLGVADNGEVLGFGDFTGHQLASLGHSSQWAERVAADRCQVYPLDDGCDTAPPLRRLALGVQEGMAIVGADRRVVAWGRQRDGSGNAVHIGVQARTLASRDDSDQVLGAGLDGRLGVWVCEYRSSSPFANCFSRGPLAVAGPGRVVQLEFIDHDDVVALRADGRLWRQSTEFPGDGSPVRPISVPLFGLPRLRQLARSGWGSQMHDVLGIDLDGTPWQIDLIGDGAIAWPMRGLPPMRSAACSHHNCLLLAADGRVWAWGGNGHGQLGLGRTTVEFRSDPQPVPGLAGIVDVAASAASMFAVDGDGRVWSWGMALARGSSAPLLGRAGTEPVPVPTAVPGVDGVLEIVVSRYTVLVRRRDGSVWGWGHNGWGAIDPRPEGRGWYDTPVALPVTGLDLR